MYTVKDLVDILKDMTDDFYGYHYLGDAARELIDYKPVNSSLGVLEEVAQFGGEGQGDQAYFVFSVINDEGTRFFRVDGCHSSYEGTYYDGDIYEVKPVETTIVEYEAI